MDTTYAALAESDISLYDLAEQLAYENFQSYDLYIDIAESEGYDPDEMTDSDWDELWKRCNETDYYGFNIEEFNGDEEEWNDYGEPYEV